MFILGGLATIASGVVLCGRPGLGAVALALLFGLFNLIAGIWMLVQGTELRHTGKALHAPGTVPHRERTRPEPCLHMRPLRGMRSRPPPRWSRRRSCTCS
jgi:hypothetical protein